MHLKYLLNSNVVSDCDKKYDKTGKKLLIIKIPMKMGRSLIQQSVILSDKLTTYTLWRRRCLHDHFLTFLLLKRYFAGNSKLNVKS